MRFLHTDSKLLFADLVSYITDWKQNNQIRSDRYKPSVYSSLLLQLGDEGRSENPPDDQSATAGKPTDNHLETQYRLGKVRLDQARAAGACAPPKRERFAPPSFEEVRDYMIKYAAEHELEIDAALQAEKFISYHDSRGWISGQSGRKIKRWKGAVGTWMCNLRELAEAMHRLAEIANDRAASESIRSQAAQAVFGICIKIVETLDAPPRLEALKKYILKHQ